MLESTLLSVRQPSRRTLTAFRNVFSNVSNPKGRLPALGGHSARILDDKWDLMALRNYEDEDRLTSVLRHCFPILFVVSSKYHFTSARNRLSKDETHKVSDSKDQHRSHLHLRTPPPYRRGRA